MRVVLLAGLMISVAAIEPAMAVDGCPTTPVETMSTTYSLNNSAISVTYDAFQTNISPSSSESSSCDRPIATLMPSEVFGVYSADYRAFVLQGDTATLSVTHDGVTDVQVIHDEAADVNDVVLSTFVGSRQGQINSTIDLALTSPDDTSSANLDTVDYLLLGQTTMGSVEDSLDDLAIGRAAIVTHLSATAGLLDGEAHRAEDNQITLLGALGSHTVGLSGHYNIADGFSVDAGGAFIGQDVGGSSAEGFLFSGMARYVAPADGGLSLFGGAGLTAAPGLSLGFTRHYDDGSDDGATVHATTHGTLLAATIEGGILIESSSSDRFALTGSLTHSWLGLDGYDETFGPDNLFPVSTSDSDSSFDTVKLGGSWTTAVTNDLDLTLSGAVGQNFASGHVDADVAFVGPVSVSARSELFAEYEARLGWALSPTSDLDVFARGSTGSESGTHMQAGTSLTLKF